MDSSDENEYPYVDVYVEKTTKDINKKRRRKKKIKRRRKQKLYDPLCTLNG